GSNQAPPSEKESGVTLTTPMTRHRPGAGRPGTTALVMSPNPMPDPNPPARGLRRLRRPARPAVSASTYSPPIPGKPHSAPHLGKTRLLRRTSLDTGASGRQGPRPAASAPRAARPAAAERAPA